MQGVDAESIVCRPDYSLAARSVTREAMANETPLWASAQMPLRALPGRVTISPRRSAGEQCDELAPPHGTHPKGQGSGTKLRVRKL
jgi:hypothetical protein